MLGLPMVNKAHSTSKPALQHSSLSGRGVETTHAIRSPHTRGTLSAKNIHKLRSAEAPAGWA